MQKIALNKEIIDKVPGVVLSCIECTVTFQEQNTELWNEIEQKIQELNKILRVEDISKISAVSASRIAYKKCGKDPARYRLSAEALLRRVLKRQAIYQVNNVVDLLNLVSISTGFSIGGYDADLIEGMVTFGIGTKDELYEGIGRGKLNIESMPVFRDSRGAFGTPTSDSVRTCVTNATTRFLMIIIAYEPCELLEEATLKAQHLLKKYAGAEDFELKTIEAR